jgi:SM-20-related protein
MPTHEFFRPLGLFTRPNFLTPEECARLLDEANTSDRTAATVYRADRTLTDEQFRKTLQTALGASARDWVTTRIRSLAPELRSHFGLDLASVGEIGCLIYRPGDFFEVHSDTAEVQSDIHRPIERRKVSVVVFLNEPDHPVHPFQGGELTFYGLMDVPDSRAYGFPLQPETGLLVAFRSTVWHGISPVAEGFRYTLVGWMH